MKTLQRNLNRSTFAVWEMKTNVSVFRFKFRCDILISGKIIKEMPGSVASGTPCIVVSVMHGHTDIKHIGYACVFITPVYISKLLYVSGLSYETHEVTYVGPWRWCLAHWYDLLFLGFCPSFNFWRITKFRQPTLLPSSDQKDSNLLEPLDRVRSILKCIS